MLYQQYQHLPGIWEEQGLAGTSRKLMIGLSIYKAIIKCGQISSCVKTKIFLHLKVSSYLDTSLYGVIRATDKLLETGTVLVTCWRLFLFHSYSHFWNKMKQWWHRITCIELKNELSKISKPTGTSGHSGQLINLLAKKNSGKYLFNSLHSQSVFMTHAFEFSVIKMLTGTVIHCHWSQWKNAFADFYWIRPKTHTSSFTLYSHTWSVKYLHMGAVAPRPTILNCMGHCSKHRITDVSELC